MDAVMHPAAFEFGRSGRTYDREAILDAAPVPFGVVLPLRDFVVHPLAPGAALTTYVSTATYEEVEVSNRSTIWLLDGEAWRWVFHQGTPRHPPH
jgi:hypothetical protein